jgi:hypothetical protein
MFTGLNISLSGDVNNTDKMLKEWSQLSHFDIKPEALKSLYRSPGYKKNQLVKTMSCSGSHLGIPINIKNTKFVKELDGPLQTLGFLFRYEIQNSGYSST